MLLWRGQPTTLFVALIAAAARRGPRSPTRYGRAEWKQCCCALPLLEANGRELRQATASHRSRHLCSRRKRRVVCGADIRASTLGNLVRERLRPAVTAAGTATTTAAATAAATAGTTTTITNNIMTASAVCIVNGHNQIRFARPLAA